MKRLLMLAGAGAAATGLITSTLVAVPAVAADPPCAQMGGTVTILEQSTPTCVELYTSGPSSIRLPADAPRIIYGVVNMVSPGVAPTTVTGQNGQTYALNPNEGNRWLSVGSRVASQTIVKAEIVNNRIGKTFPYLYITDDAITDRFLRGDTWSTEDGTEVRQDRRFDPLSGFLTIDSTWTRRRRVERRSHRIRLYTASHLAALMDAAGLEVTAAYDGFGAGALTRRSHEMLLVARRR